MKKATLEMLKKARDKENEYDKINTLELLTQIMLFEDQESIPEELRLMGRKIRGDIDKFQDKLCEIIYDHEKSN